MEKMTSSMYEVGHLVKSTWESIMDGVSSSLRPMTLYLDGTVQ